MSVDVVVIGAGFSGLAAGWRAAAAGRRVRVVATGWGATHWHSGCIGVLGYYPVEAETIQSPWQAVERLVRDQPEHPYAAVGLERLEAGLKAFQDLCEDAGYPIQGTLEQNWLLPSAVGSFRPSCFVPETMVAGDLRRRDPMLIVGFDGFRDFYPGLVADNLAAQGVLARGLVLGLPSFSQRRELSAMTLARLFETESFREELADSLHSRLGEADRVGFPAVLGVNDVLKIKQDLERRLEREIFEIPILPPSVPGIRLHRILVDAIESMGGRVFEGMQVLSDEIDGKRVTTVWSEAAGRNRAHRAADYVLATGGILGGGIEATIDGDLHELIFDLPVAGPPSRKEWFSRDFLGKSGHAIHRSGVRVDASWRAVDSNGALIFENLRVAGANLASWDGVRERSLEGVALTTGYVVGEEMGKGK